ALAGSALLVRSEQNFFAVPAFCEFLDDIPGEVPIRVFPGLSVRLANAPFPGGLKFRDVVFGEQSLPLLFVLAVALQIGPQLTGSWRVDVSFFDVIEECEHAVEILLRDGIVLVVVALGTADAHPKPYHSDRASSIDGVLESELRVVHPALTIGESVA